MRNFAALAVLFALTACGGSRADECEIDGCDSVLIDGCKTSVESCETAGGALQDTCIDAVIAAQDAVCAIDTDAS